MRAPALHLYTMNWNAIDLVICPSNRFKIKYYVLKINWYVHLKEADGIKT